MKIGVLCPAEIAIRRFMPALSVSKYFEFAGVAVYRPEERFSQEELKKEDINQRLEDERKKALKFTEQYGGKIYDGYESIIEDSDIESIYIPLPPALHYIWTKRALEKGKHVFVEKPFCVRLTETQELISLSNKYGLAVHENYMFVYHKQIEQLKRIIEQGEIGNVRLYRINFGFPMRGANDFRYSKKLGGGALLDAGGYTLKYASYLLNDDIKIVSAILNYIEDFEVDLYGSGSIVDSTGATVQIAFGMDNSYKCELEVWGSEGYLKSERVLTAPAGYSPKVTIVKKMGEEVRELDADDAFFKSIQRFEDCIKCKEICEEEKVQIENQAILLETFLKNALQYRI